MGDRRKAGNARSEPTLEPASPSLVPRAENSAGQLPKQRCYIIPESGGTSWGRYTAVAKCPECGALIDIEEDEVEQGEIISCPDCAVDLEIVNTHPLEFDVLEEEDEEEEGEESKGEGEDADDEEESEDEDDGFH
jgi:alpha-aminoadipate carrier protein LysW